MNSPVFVSFYNARFIIIKRVYKYFSDSANINHKGLQRTANEYAEERRIYKDLISKNNNVDMLNSASRVLQCWSYYVKIISAGLLRYLTVHLSKLDLICKKTCKRLFCLGCWTQNDEQALFIRLWPFVENQTVLLSRRTLNWGCVFLSVQLTWNEISGFISKFIIKVSDELTLSTQVCLLHWKINPSRRFTICFIRVGFRRNNCHSRVSGELKMEQQQYSLFATTWQGGHVGVQYNKIFSGRIYMKIEFTSQRREMLLVLTTSKPPWRHAHTSNN